MLRTDRTTTQALLSSLEPLSQDKGIVSRDTHEAIYCAQLGGTVAETRASSEADSAAELVVRREVRVEREPEAGLTAPLLRPRGLGFSLWSVPLSSCRAGVDLAFPEALTLVLDCELALDFFAEELGTSSSTSMMVRFVWRGFVALMDVAVWILLRVALVSVERPCPAVDFRAGTLSTTMSLSTFSCGASASALVAEVGTAIAVLEPDPSEVLLRDEPAAILTFFLGRSSCSCSSSGSRLTSGSESGFSPSCCSRARFVPCPFISCSGCFAASAAFRRLSFSAFFALFSPLLLIRVSRSYEPPMIS